MNCHDMSQCRVRLEEGKSYFASHHGWHFKLVMGILEGQKDPRKGSLTYHASKEEVHLIVA